MRNKFFAWFLFVILLSSCESKEDKFQRKFTEFQNQMNEVNKNIETIILPDLLRKLKKIKGIVFEISEFISEDEDRMKITEGLYPFLSVNDLQTEITLIESIIGNEEAEITNHLMKLIAAEEIRKDIDEYYALSQQSSYLLMKYYLANKEYKRAERVGNDGFKKAALIIQFDHCFKEIVEYYYEQGYAEDLYTFKRRDEYYYDKVYHSITENIESLEEVKTILEEYYPYDKYDAHSFDGSLCFFHVRLLSFYDVSIAQDEFRKHRNLYLSAKDYDDYSYQYYRYITDLLDTNLYPFIFENWFEFTEWIPSHYRQNIYTNIISRDIRLNNRSRQYIDEKLAEIYNSIGSIHTNSRVNLDEIAGTASEPFINDEYKKFLKDISYVLRRLNRLEDCLYYCEKADLVRNTFKESKMSLHESIEQGISYWMKGDKDIADAYFTGSKIDEPVQNSYNPEDIYYLKIKGLINTGHDEIARELLEHAPNVLFRDVELKSSREAILASIYYLLNDYEKAYDYAIKGFNQQYRYQIELMWDYRNTSKIQTLVNLYSENETYFSSVLFHQILLLLECEDYSYIAQTLESFVDDATARVFYLYAKYREFAKKIDKVELLRLHAESSDYFEQVLSFLVYYEKYFPDKSRLSHDEQVLLYLILSDRY